MGGSEKREIRERTYGDTEMSASREHVNPYASIEITEKTTAGMSSRKAILFLLPMFLLTLFWWGCEGPQGPEGEGVGDLDTEPPKVSWVEPVRSDTTYANTFEVEATASDNEGVAYVEFFLDGSSEMGDSSAIDSTAPYTWTWNFDSTGHDFGFYPIMARAFDGAENAADTPTLLKHYLPVPTERVLYYYEGETLGALTMPDEYGDRFWNVRFTPDEECELLEIQLEFRNPLEVRLTDEDDFLTGGTDFMVYAWNSGDNRLPVEPPLDSLYVEETQAVYNEGFTVVDVSNWGLTLTDDFHAGFSIPSALNYGQLIDDLRAMPIIFTLDDTPPADSSAHRSVEKANGQNWRTMLQSWKQPIDFHIRVKVRYSSGETATIAPTGSRIPLPDGER